MKTKRWKVQPTKEIEPEIIQEAIKLLKEGEVLAFPTETVYGLGADATKDQAVQRIFQAKGRPADNPLIAHVSSKAMLESLIIDKPSYVDKLIDAYSPGPLTYVLKSNGSCAKGVTAGLSTLAVRMPNHPVALQLINYFDGPIAAPSANTSGKPSPVTADHVYADLVGKIPALLDAGPTGVGLESTVIDCTGDLPVILRPGAITEEEISAVAGGVISAPSSQTRSDQYKHYKPEVPLYLLDQSIDQVKEFVHQEQVKGNRIGVLGSHSFIKEIEGDDSFSLGEESQEIARNLYAGFRYFKKARVDLVICQAFSKEGLGKTIMNRIEKAANKIIS